MSVGEPFETSDHRLIRYNLMCKYIRSDETSETFNFFKADYSIVQEYANTRKWEECINIGSVDELWTIIKRELITIRDKFIPKFKKSRRKNKWVNKLVIKYCRRAKVKFGINILCQVEITCCMKNTKLN